MVNEQGFNPSQLDEVNDVVQRAGFSDKRKRNLAIRSGMENPGAFQQENSGIIQEAQQPSEFVGAGRKLAANQNPDSSIASLFQGNLAKHGNEWYSYGDTDYSSAQFGTDGYNLNSLGSGIYDIMGKSGSSLGKYYKAPGEAVNEIWNTRNPYDGNEYELSRIGGSDDYNPYTYNRLDGGAGAIDPNSIRQTGGTDWDPNTRFFGKLQAQENPYRQTGGGQLEDWENLGMILAGRTPARNTRTNSHANRFYSQDNATQYIQGLNTLYGSSPLIMNDKLLGYKMDLTPNTATGDWGFRGEDINHLARIDNNGKTRSSSQIWREMADTDTWDKYTQGLGNDDVFVKPEDADKLPGWYNKESRFSAEQKSGGLGGLGKIFSILGPILSFTPLAPIGYAMSAINSLANDNPLGAIASIFGGISGLGSADLAGMGGVDQAVSGGFSGADLVDFATPSSSLSSLFSGINPSLLSAGVGGISSAIKGQNPLIGALGSGLGSFASGELQKLFDGDAIGKITGGAASTGIKSLFNQNQAIRGSEQGAHSGSLSGFINNNSPSAQNNQQEISPEEKQQLALDLQRKLIQRRQQEQLGGA